MTKRPRPLTPRWRAFVAAYLTSFSPQRAAIEAGYAKRHANRAGWLLLHKPAIAAEVERRLKLTEDASTLDLLEARQILTRIARARLADFMGADGLPDAEKIRQAGQEVAELQIVERVGADGDVTRAYKLKLRDAASAVMDFAELAGWRKATTGPVIVLQPKFALEDIRDVVPIEPAQQEPLGTRPEPPRLEGRPG